MSRNTNAGVKKDVILEPSCDYGDWLRWRDVNNGVIRIDRDINEESARIISMELDVIRRRKPKLKNFTIKISSPGGEIYGSLTIYDLIRSMSNMGIKSTAIVEGWAASASAAIILQAADVRLCTKSSRFLLHEASQLAFFSDTKASELKDEAKELEIVNDIIFKILAERCGRTFDEIRKIIERREVWLSAKDAIEFGLIDGIVS